jgi:ribonuclease HII
MPDFSYEKRLWKKGFNFIAGADEVGRGAFAGPVVAACFLFAPTANYKLLDTI